MNVYTSDILAATVAFPFIALGITLPYLIFQYRKLGAVPWLHTLIVYSFVFYLLCAYFLVLLPLPADHHVVVPYAQTPQLVPFNFVTEFLAEASFSAGDPTTWLVTLRDPYVYEAAFNVLLLVPLGMYLRYYFRRTWWQTVLIGFAITLSFELTQLTGIWGIYAHPYRLFDVDDLILNTFGALVGFWIVGPMMRMLPDMRLVNEEARDDGVRASVTRRAFSFSIDLALAQVVAGILVTTASNLGVAVALEGRQGVWGLFVWCTDLVIFLALFAVVPIVTCGQTLGQKLLHLRIVRPDATPAHWYQPLTRYGLLTLFVWLPFAALFGLAELEPGAYGGAGSLTGALTVDNGAAFVAWAVLMAVWAVTLVVRAFRSWQAKRPFVMLNGLLSNSRVMTEAGIVRERERRVVLNVAQVAELERAVAEDGTPLSTLMERAGAAVAAAVCARVPDPAPVVVLTGTGNNGGDGWACARILAEAGYPVTLIAPDLAERLKAEPARTMALDTFAHARDLGLPLSVIVAPDADVLNAKVDEAAAIVDAILGTGFSGDEVREPFASWIEAANRRRFEGSRGPGRGAHRKRTNKRGNHERRTFPSRVKDAPFAVAADVPSGLSAQTGVAAQPCFAADITVTMIVFKPGLVMDRTNRWTGAVRLAKLVDTQPYLNNLHAGKWAQKTLAHSAPPIES